MGMRNSKKSVDIAASTGSPKKNGTEPTEVKVKELVEPVQNGVQTELIEEVAAKEEAATKLEDAKLNGDAPKSEEKTDENETPVKEVSNEFKLFTYSRKP